jgi:hypothetical protein
MRYVLLWWLFVSPLFVQGQITGKARRYAVRSPINEVLINRPTVFIGHLLAD